MMNFIYKDTLTRESDELLKELLDYNGQNEILLGAKYFLIDNDHDLMKLNRFLNPKNKAKVIPLINSVFLRIAGAACIIVLLVSLWQLKNRKNDNIVKAVAPAEMGLPVFAGPNKQIIIQELMNEFRMGNYSEAKRIMKKLSMASNTNDTINYFGGWVYYKENEPEIAISYLERVEKESIFFFKSELLIGICYYLADNEDHSKRIFTNITNTRNHPYKGVAKILLQRTEIW